MQIKVKNNEPTSISVNRIGLYNNYEDNNSIFDANSKIVFLGDSWTQYTEVSGVPQKNFPERIKERLVAIGGNASNVINNGRSGMTSGWGRYWFEELVLDETPTHAVIHFYINDNNSSPSFGNPAITSWNFSSVSPFVSGTDVDGKTTSTIWLENIKYIIRKCIENNITPIVMMPSHTGSITQTQNILNNHLSIIGTDNFYNIVNAKFKTLESEFGSITNFESVLANITNLITTKLTSGNNSIGGFGILEYLEANSSAAKGYVVRPDNFRNITGGYSFVVQKGNGTAYVDIFRVGVNGVELVALNKLTINDFSINRISANPEGAISATKGSVALNVNGNLDTLLHLKTSGTGNTGWKNVQPLSSGTTANRPTVNTIGFVYFDTTLNKPIWWDGTGWRDATGTVI